ncbi:MAG TPA: NAD-dependent epimerase/dehydratase family protein [Myxococcales bacterium]|nr:NAD-dependent epimerase/dehydratase family protein [Myxococcales bacterium]
MAKRVLITGGAGFLGINLVRHLHAHGYEPVSLDTAPFDYADMLPHTEVIQGDIRDRPVLEKAMSSVDYVVHSAAALALCPEAEIRSVEVYGTRRVLEMAERLKLERFVHISTTAVYGVPDHHPLLETDPLDGVGPYGRAKVDAEQLCVEARQRGLCVSVIRPKSFVGPERLGIFAVLYDWAQSGKNFPLIGNGKNRYQLLDVEDLCQAIRLCLEKPVEAVNDVFNIGAAEFATMREDYQAVLDEAGFHKRAIPFPAAPAIAALRLLDRLKLSPLYPWVYETAAKDSFVSIERAKEKLGYAPQYSNQQALVRNYRWYVENLPKFQNTTGKTHRSPWKQGALSVIKRAF